jgi:polyhydroxyalkanoate synthase
MVPAPIKRAYIWDLAPGASVVRRCLRAGLGVYLIRWTDPGPTERDFGLADYADRLIAGAVDAIAAEPAGAEPRRVVLAGHSLGGTLAAIFAARRPDAVQGLVLIEAPLRFGAEAGAFAPLVALAPHAARIRAGFDDRVPGSFLDLISAAAAPEVFQGERWADRALSLGDAEALTLHWRVERWTLDEFPMPGRLFEEVVELLYREDRFARGDLRVAGGIATPARVSAPVLSVYDPRSRVVPPSSILPVHDAFPGPGKCLLSYEGDRGVCLQHVGALVGRNAHRQLWPEILDWVRRL